ncbi:MAG: universal stress protein [Acidimicrobiia bacterium]|nr:universal stress protein [Acidimicrobiia bacterium]
MRHLLLAFGGSPSSVMASHWAASYASARDAAVTIAHVLPPDRAHDGASAPELSELASPELIAVFEEAGVAHDSRLLMGDAAAQILAAADEMDADMIIMGRRIHTFAHPRLLGPLTRRLLDGTNRPVAIVPAPFEQPGREQVLPTAVVGIDGSEESPVVFDVAMKVAQPLGLDLEALTVLGRDHAPEADQTRWLPDTAITRSTGQEGPRSQIRVSAPTLVGIPTDELLARSALAEALILGTHRHSPLGRLLDQSTSHFCAARASCPVVLVPLD